MTGLILKRADRLERRRLRRGRGRRRRWPHLQGADRARRPPLDVDDRPPRRHTARGRRLRADARGRDGGMKALEAEVSMAKGRASLNGTTEAEMK